MKITIVQGAFYPVPTLRGGAIEKIWFALGQEFARRGHEVTHYSRLCDGLPARETISGVRHIRVLGADTPSSRLRQKWRDFCFTWRVRGKLTPADVIITHTFFSPMLFSPRRHGAIWVHVQRYPQGQMRFYPQAARLQTVSRVIAHAMVNQLPSSLDRVRIIRNPLPPLAQLAQPIARDPNLVLFVGRLHAEKGIELLVEAAALARSQAPSLRFRVVGPHETRFGGGGDALLEKLKLLAQSSDANVEFTGSVFDEAALATHYAAASVFVYPSLAAKGEASPVAPLEALARGCPVVTSDLECFNDTIGFGAFASRFDHTAADASARLLTSIRAAIGNPVSWSVASEAAIVRANEFSIERIATEYLAGFSVLPADES
ncbi:glycosyltransferase family 4 protein [Oleiharenicola lentus]|uniref:glycosyltransferase family 4 protein n=1 Tax=Oleiharenicola lentus TaxID=2508720 RepID=UPI003F667578